MLEVLFNIHFCKGRSIIVNCFIILKEKFKNLLMKINLHVFFLHDVICCCIPYNMILNGKT